MTRRRATVAVVFALVLAGVAAGVGACAAAGATAKRPAAASSTTRASTAACAKRHRPKGKCRHARVAAGYKRGQRRGRALLARPLIGSAPVTAAPAPNATADPGTAPAPGAGGTVPPPAPVASSVGAEAYDFGTFVLRLTRTSVVAGNLTIYFRNHDVSEHNLWLDPPAASGGAPVMISAAVGEGGGATKTVSVTPGTWRLFCSLTGHEVMTRDLAVE